MEIFWSYDLFIIGVPEDNLSLGNENCPSAPDKIRLSLIWLYEGGLEFKDFGFRKFKNR